MHYSVLKFAILEAYCQMKSQIEETPQLKLNVSWIYACSLFSILAWFSLFFYFVQSLYWNKVNELSTHWNISTLLLWSFLQIVCLFKCLRILFYHLKLHFWSFRKSFHKWLRIFFHLKLLFELLESHFNHALSVFILKCLNLLINSRTLETLPLNRYSGYCTILSSNRYVLKYSSSINSSRVFPVFSW